MSIYGERFFLILSSICCIIVRCFHTKYKERGRIEVKNVGVYSGATILNEHDLLNVDGEHKIMLEYYRTKKHYMKSAKLKTFYGIKIVKRKYEKDKIISEENNINKISTNKGIIDEIIQKLREYKVTPIGLNDVLTDLLKQPQYQGE